MKDTKTRFVPNLDDMLTPEEAAAWLRLKPRDLAEKSKGLRPAIPAFRPSFKTIRYHPRTILAKMAKDSGVSLELIAASYGMVIVKQP